MPKKKKTRLLIGDFVVPVLGGPLCRITEFVDDCDCDDGDAVQETDHVEVEWFARGKYVSRHFAASDPLFSARR